jgi:hypothetical protein
MRRIQRHAWLLLFVVGLFFLYYGIDNAFVIPNLECNDPDRGWEWLTCEPEIIAYIRFWFRMLGIWVLGVAAVKLVVAAGGYRRMQRWAWWALWIVPALLLSQMIYIPYFAWLYGVFLLMALAGLLIPFRRFFPG